MRRGARHLLLIAQEVILPKRFGRRRSAGSKPRAFRSKACAARAGTSLRNPHAPKLDFIFTVCDNAANEVCPTWPGQSMTAHWGIPDPAKVQGSPQEIERALRNAFTLLDRRILLFLSLPLSSIEQRSRKNSTRLDVSRNSSSDCGNQINRSLYK